MNGKTVFVTGATSGIGLAAARSLSRMGARILIGARDAAKGQALVDELTRSGGRADLVPLDLASFESTRGGASRVAALHPALDVLVDNAGTAVREREVTADGHERTWQTNHLGPFLLTRLLLPVLRAAEKPRVVIVASEAHRTGRIDFANLELENGYRAFRAYANTKLANVLFMRELARREPTLSVNALHPGTIATGIWRPAPAWARLLTRILLARPQKGADPVVRLASAPELDGVTGVYFNRFRESTPSAAARDDAAARRLWEISETAAG